MMELYRQQSPPTCLFFDLAISSHSQKEEEKNSSVQKSKSKTEEGNKKKAK